MSGVEIGALTILVSSMVWYLKYQTKRQAKREDTQDVERAEREAKRDEERKEEMLFVRSLLTNDLKDLHKDNSRNIDLNNQSIGLLKNVGENQNKLCKLIESVDRRINGKK